MRQRGSSRAEKKELPDSGDIVVVISIQNRKFHHHYAPTGARGPPVQVISEAWRDSLAHLSPVAAPRFMTAQGTGRQNINETRRHYLERIYLHRSQNDQNKCREIIVLFSEAELTATVRSNSSSCLSVPSGVRETADCQSVFQDRSKTS